MSIPFLYHESIKSYWHVSVFKNLKTALENFTRVYKIANNFRWTHNTEKVHIYLESWNIEDFKNVHHFTVALSCQKL